MDCSPPGSSVHGILRARILEWVAIPFSRGSSQPRDQTQVSCIAGSFFTINLFEVGYNTLEFAFDKALTISEVDKRFNCYMTIIQPFLSSHHHLLTGMGVNPFWEDRKSTRLNSSHH